MFQQDMILRAIEQLARAIAQVMRLSVQEEKYEQALEAVASGKRALPLVPGMLEHLSAEQLLTQLGPDAVRALADLYEAEAGALEGLRRPAEAERVRRRASALRGAVGDGEAGAASRLI